jgi:Kef-type K+ transport system membrane component KefB
MSPPVEAAAATSAVGARAEEVVLHLLLQIVAIIVATRIVVWAAKKIGQTDVAGEILAGLVLGPSLLGAFAPSLMHKLFIPETAPIFVGFAQIGLVLLMFQIGLEFEFKRELSASKLAIVVVSLFGMVVPFGLGYLSAGWFHAQLPLPRPSLMGFRLFFAIAMSITAIPILGRVFMELDLSHTRTAALTIGAAAIDDVAGWLLLGVVTLLVQGGFDARWLLVRVGALAAYLTFVMVVARPILKRRIHAHLERHDGRLQPIAVSLLLLVLFVSGLITSTIGVFAIIGGFVVGVSLHDDRRFVAEWKSRVGSLVNAFFLPIFFAYTGLRTDVHGLTSRQDWLVCGAVVGLAFATKFGGAFVGARLVGEDNRSALAIGVSMNTRALMELIAINIGYDLGVIPRSMFTMLVIMAIASTYVTTPILRRLMRRERQPIAPIPAAARSAS